MTRPAYVSDAYLKELDTKVVSVNDDKFIVFEDSIFYPNGGGQPNDAGKVIKGSEEYQVVFCRKVDGTISCEVDKPGLKQGDAVKCILDWDRRFMHMRMHTAAHIVAEALHRLSGALTTGNQLNAGESRIDSNFEYSPELIENTFKMANEVVDKDMPISAEFLSREEAEKIPVLTKLAKGLPSNIEEVRMVRIGDFDMQADGGTHVRSTKEVGKIYFSRYASKGKNNKRVYFKLEE